MAGPQTLSLIGVTYAGRDRVRAITAYGVTLGLAAVLGQLFGGALIQAGILGLGWRTCFLVNLPIGLAALIAAPRLLAESRGNAAGRLDLAGTALVTAGLIAVILPLVDGRQEHWPAWAWLCLAASAPILGAFAAHQRWRLRHGRTPLVDLSAGSGRPWAAWSWRPAWPRCGRWSPEARAARASWPSPRRCWSPGSAWACSRHR